MPEDTTNTTQEEVKPEVPESTPAAQPEVPVAPVIDLAKERDDKCVPIAHDLFAGIVPFLLPTDKMIDYKGLVTLMLTKCLEADLNVTTEVQYIPQLMMTPLSGLNTLLATSTAVKPMDDDRFAEIGKKMLAMVADARIRLTNVKPEETMEDLTSVKSLIDKLIEEEQLTKIEIKYIMDNIFQTYKNGVSVFNQSLEDAMRRAEAKVFGVEDMGDVTMKKLDGFLTAENVDAIK